MYIIQTHLPLIEKCVIEVEYKELAQFAQRQLKNYVTEISREDNTRMGVISSLTINNHKLIQIYKNYMNANLGLAGNLNWNNHNLTDGCYEYSVNDLFKIKCRKPNRKKGYIKRLYRWLKARSEEQKYAFLGGEFYRYVLFPILSVYAAAFGLYCIHGSFIHSEGGKNIILSGLDGVGKSSLANLICDNPENTLLADNIVLFNGKKALNLNLAMRLENTAVTKQKIIYRNKNIMEVIPGETDYGMCRVDSIYNILRGNTGSEIVRYGNLTTTQCWILFMERAPEIRQANEILSYWFFAHSILYGSEEMEIPVISLSIPNGKLNIGKEVILDELKIFS